MDSEQHNLFRAEEEPFQKYVASSQGFKVCPFCCLCILPGEVVFDLSDDETCHDDCGIEQTHQEEE